MLNFKKFLVEKEEILTESHATRAHWQAAVNHILLHEPEHHDKLIKAHSEILSKLSSHFSPERFEKEVKGGKTYEEKIGLPRLHQKHFEAVATYLHQHSDPWIRENVGEHYASIFSRSNPNFDEGRFRTWVQQGHGKRTGGKYPKGT